MPASPMTSGRSTRLRIFVSPCSHGLQGLIETKGPRLPFQATAAPNGSGSTSSLLAVADAIDRTGPVVGHEDRSILVEDDVVGAAEIALVAFDPAVCEHRLLGVLAVGIDGDANDARA